jgi:hypothetical protein
MVLFDNGTPRTLAKHLIDRHTVTEARARGWDRLENGDLLNAAESAGFEVLVTTDKNLTYQQNLASRRIAIVVLGQGRWTLIQPLCQKSLRQFTPRDQAALPRSKCPGNSNDPVTAASHPTPLRTATFPPDRPHIPPPCTHSPLCTRGSDSALSNSSHPRSPTSSSSPCLRFRP